MVKTKKKQKRLSNREVTSSITNAIDRVHKSASIERTLGDLRTKRRETKSKTSGDIEERDERRVEWKRRS